MRGIDKFSETHLAQKSAYQFKDNLYLRHYELADLVQECLTRLAQEKKRQRRKHFPKYYLRRLFKNHLLDLIKTAKAVKRAGEWITIPIEEMSVEPGTSPTYRWGEDIRAEQVARVIQQVPRNLQQIYHLIYVQGLSYQRAARKLGLHRETLRFRLRKLHETIRKKLTD